MLRAIKRIKCVLLLRTRFCSQSLFPQPSTCTLPLLLCIFFALRNLKSSSPSALVSSQVTFEAFLSFTFPSSTHPTLHPLHKDDEKTFENANTSQERAGRMANTQLYRSSYAWKRERGTEYCSLHPPVCLYQPSRCHQNYHQESVWHRRHLDPDRVGMLTSPSYFAAGLIFYPRFQPQSSSSSASSPIPNTSGPAIRCVTSSPLSAPELAVDAKQYDIPGDQVTTGLKMVMGAEISFAAASTFTKLSMLTFSRRLMANSNLPFWRLVNVLAMCIVSVQGLVFCLTIIWQCRWTDLQRIQLHCWLTFSDLSQTTGTSVLVPSQTASIRQATSWLQELSTFALTLQLCFFLYAWCCHYDYHDVIWLWLPCCLRSASSLALLGSQGHITCTSQLRLMTRFVKCSGRANSS